MVTVQVLIPCYNYGRYLEQCVESVLQQEGVDLDILIIDDCSSDHTPEVCRALQDRDARIRVIHHETNAGHIATFNEGMADIRGDYFVLLSADDLLTPGALSRATSLMQAHPKVGMAYGQPICFQGDELPEARTMATGSSVWNGRHWMRHVCRSGKNFVVCPEAVVRTDVQRQIGGYNPKLPQSGDMEMWLRIACVSDIGRVHGADQAYYRVHAQSMLRTVHAGLLTDLIARRDAFQSVFDGEGSSLAEREELHLLAKRALAFTALQHARKLLESHESCKDDHEAYVDFATSLCPEIIGSRRYRMLKTMQRRERGFIQRAVAVGGRLRKSFDDAVVSRAEYHWAKRTGVYFPRWII